MALPTSVNTATPNLSRQVALQFEGASQQVAAASAHAQGHGRCHGQPRHRVGLQARDHRRELLVGEAADAAVTAGIEAENAGQVLENCRPRWRRPRRAAAGASAPLRFSTRSECTSRRRKLEFEPSTLVRTDQLGVQRAREQFLAEVALRHRGVGDAGHDPGRRRRWPLTASSVVVVCIKLRSRVHAASARDSA